MPPHLEPAVSASWRTADITGPDGAATGLDLHPYRYVMVAADDYAAVVADRVHWAVSERGWSMIHVGEEVQRIEDGPGSAMVVTPTTSVTGSWVFDSRPHPGTGGKTRLLQHFRGHLVRCAGATFDAQRISLMDFCMPQPSDGVAFGYCLPVDARTALIEYTMFTPDLLTDDEYSARVADYRVRLGLPGQDDARVETLHVEHGVIPMTDARFEPHPGRHVRRLGSAGGATRPSTGYTFAAILRQAEAIATALAAGRAPTVPSAYPRRHELLDAVMLAALRDGHLDGAQFFTDLWARNPPQRVLEFLDGTSTPRQEAAIIASSPALGMLGGVRSLLAPPGRQALRWATRTSRRR